MRIVDESEFVVGDYANLEEQLVIVVGHPTEERVPVLVNGRIMYPIKELFNPLTDIQKKSIKVYHMASLYGVVKELEELLRENLKNSEFIKDSEESPSQ